MYMRVFVCVSACVRKRVRARVYMCVWGGGGGRFTVPMGEGFVHMCGVCVCVCVCV